MQKSQCSPANPPCSSLHVSFILLGLFVGFLAAASHFSNNGNSLNLLLLQCMWLQRTCNPKLQSASPPQRLPKHRGTLAQWFQHPTHASKNPMQEAHLHNGTGKACKCAHLNGLADGVFKHSHLYVFTPPLLFSSLLCFVCNISCLWLSPSVGGSLNRWWQALSYMDYRLQWESKTAAGEDTQCLPVTMVYIQHAGAI